MDPQQTVDNPAEQPQIQPDSPEYFEHMTKLAATADPSIVPAQFGGDVDKYAASVKEQRATLTRTQQDNADLRRRIEELEANATSTPTNEQGTEGGTTDAPNGNQLIPNSKQKETGEDSTSTGDPDGSDGGGDSDSTTPSLVTFEQVQADLVSNEGKFSTDLREQLSKFVAPEILDRVEQLEAANMELTAIKAANIVGGQDVLQALITKASEELSPEQIDVINADLSDPRRMETTLRGLQAQFGLTQAEQPTPNPEGVNRVVSTTNVNAGNSQPFNTPQEMTVATGDPRYGVDEAYTNEVQERMRKSFQPR